MSDDLHDTRVRTVNQGYNQWRVQVLFPDQRLTAAEITRRLHEVKKDLAERFGVPEYLLRYEGLQSKSVTRSGLLVRMLLTKRDVASGPPQFRTQAMQAADGTWYQDMIVEGDFFPYDEFENPLTSSIVDARLVTARIDLTCVDWKAIDAILDTLSTTKLPVYSACIARGHLPDIGRSSHLLYASPKGADTLVQTAWLGAFPVKAGDFLVEVSSPSAGQHTGKNVYGRELTPRSGTETRLEAGEGALLCLQGTVAKAWAEGLVVYQRSGRDRRDRDSHDLAPSRLTARVLPAIHHIEPQVFELNVTDATVIEADVGAGSRITARESLCILGNVADDVTITCQSTVRIHGRVSGARISSRQHLCIVGEVSQSELTASLTVQIVGRATDCRISATDILAREIDGGIVEALRHTEIGIVSNTRETIAAIRVDLRKFLEQQQIAGRLVIEDLQTTLGRISEVFGSQVVLQIEAGSVQRTLLRWLSEQKLAGKAPLSYDEVQECRALLEMIPVIRTQLAAIGMELRDVTAQLTERSSTLDDAEPSESNVPL